MKVIRFKKGNTFSRLLMGVTSSRIDLEVRKILEDVRKNGDTALIEYTKKFDAFNLKSKYLRVTPHELQGRARICPPAIRKALGKMIRNVKNYHEHQRQTGFTIKPEQGIKLEQKVLPLNSVGLYIPGGTAPLVSSLVMCAIPARIAGVKRIAVVTPPSNNGLHPALAEVVRALTITEVYTVGGAQAIGALAYGTKTIAAVDKIVGPGNNYVTSAKRLVNGTVAIDMIAGPSEVVIIADSSASPEYIAADLLAQAEHDGNNPVDCITTSAALARSLQKEISRQTAASVRKKYIQASLQSYGRIIIVNNLQEAVTLTNELAPEHLEVMVKNPGALLAKIKNAGSVFVGPYSPVPLGDFFAGPNHVLPTGSTARFASPLGVYDFVKRFSVTTYSKRALQKYGRDIIALAKAEGLEAHGKAVACRIN